MPATSMAQFRAMEAAKHGQSALGIPRSVGQEFVTAMPKPSTLPPRVPPSLEAHTGMARGRHRPHGRKAHDPKAAEHMATMAAHLAVGNEDGAKKAALALANHLHRAAKKKAAPAVDHRRVSPGTVSQGTDHPSPKDNAPSFAPSMTKQISAGAFTTVPGNRAQGA